MARLFFILTCSCTGAADYLTGLSTIPAAMPLPFQDASHFSIDPAVQMAAEALASLTAANAIQGGRQEAERDLAEISASMQRVKQSQHLPPMHEIEQTPWGPQALGSSGQNAQQSHWSSQQIPSSPPMQQMEQTLSGARALGSSGQSAQQSHWSSQQIPASYQMQEPQDGSQAGAYGSQLLSSPPSPQQYQTLGQPFAPYQAQQPPR